METHIKLSKEVKFILNELNKYGQWIHSWWSCS
jgi:hypothetical protein